MKRVLTVLFCIVISFVFPRQAKGEYKEIDILEGKPVEIPKQAERYFKPGNVLAPVFTGR